MANSIIALSYTIIKFGNFDYNEILFIISSTLNIFLLILGCDKKEVTTKEIIAFFKKMCLLGIISVIINIAINYKSILQLSTANDSYSMKFSAFFPNRNQFGLFMLMMIISISILMNIKFKKEYMLYLILFVANLILTMSRTSILGLVVFALMVFYYKYIKEQNKISGSKWVLYYLAALLIILSISIFLNNEYVNRLINTLFLRLENVKDGSGRFSVWKNGICIGLYNNPLFGVGRYQALELNKLLFDSSLTYFHSIYIEKFAMHGFMGLFILITLLKYVWRKVSKMQKIENNKLILKSSLITFWIISMLETTTRFSIGYADSMFLIFFFTLPIIMSNAKE